MQSQAHNDYIHRSGSTGSNHGRGGQGQGPSGRINRQRNSYNIDHGGSGDESVSITAQKRSNGRNNLSRRGRDSTTAMTATATTDKSSSQSQSVQQPQDYRETRPGRENAGGSKYGGGPGVAGMGDGIVNQNMKEDLSNWITALALESETPVKIVGFFGQPKDLSFVERLIVPLSSADSIAHENDPDLVEMNAQGDYPEPRGQVEEEGESKQAIHGGNTSDMTTRWALGLDQQDKRTGDIHVYIDRSRNTLFLQHAYLFDSEHMLSVCLESVEVVNKDYTSPDMNIDSKMISVLSALSTVKRQILQELDRFMTICWDRIGIQSPDQLRQLTTGTDNSSTVGLNERGHHGSSGPRDSMLNVFTPGRCVPVLLFVVEKVLVTVPWHEPGTGEKAIAEQLRLQVLKKSIDAMQTRLRYIFRATRLIQSIDPPSGVFDSRQLFVLPSPSSTPFVYVIPAFSGQADMALDEPVEPIGKGKDVDLDPAAAVLRQRTKAAETGQPQRGIKRNERGRRNRNAREQLETKEGENEGNGQEYKVPLTFGVPTLRELYESSCEFKNQSLTNHTGDRKMPKAGQANRNSDNVESFTSTISLESLQTQYLGPLLGQFIEGWVKNVTATGGYGNVLGKRNTSVTEVPSLQQWVAGFLGVMEALGFAPSVSPVHNNSNGRDNSDLNDQNDIGGEGFGIDSVEDGMSKLDVSTEDTQAPPPTTITTTIVVPTMAVGKEGSESGRRTTSKRYSQRCANMVQKKIQDFVQTDDVMEDL
ncbi:hypothetical protein BGZ83_007590 [Gryganskiella cystojenkinii]|nr:hypothetical protein BGZ83_007590 [Gryganskiella cystojenkinii]